MAPLSILIVTFNCARELVQPELFARHLANVLPNPRGPDILVLSLQELAPIAYSFLGGSHLVPYYERLHDTVHIAASTLGEVKYANVITRNVGLTAIMVFAREELVNQLEWIEAAGVGVGMHEMGNKGAVAARIGLSVSEGSIMEMTFVAAHLAPMENGLGRRNEDWKNIIRGLAFLPVRQGSMAAKTHTAQAITDEDRPLLSGSSDTTMQLSGLYTPASYLFLAGDLNYRTSSVKPTPKDYSKYPQPTKDTTDPKYYTHLLEDDQLTRELKAGRTCHGLREAPIDFPPTYKYSNKARAGAEADDAVAWHWANHRWPSWCDRVLYLDLPSWMKDHDPSNRIQVDKYTALPLMSTSDHRPVALLLTIPRSPVSLPENEDVDGDLRLHPPYAIDPEWRQKRVAARRKEIAVGLGAYFSLTWEGRSILLAMLIGALGAWAIVQNLVKY
ncbi:MAG: inositol 5 [Lasallia pustulata]|uniref:Inositol 5 n=1 Tax=Lasallia pustulata TaxID=136370 RepID=A0A5M8PXS5_9LECA|nr:MAG: inositol 5 [Lasallia pustulata]